MIKYVLVDPTVVKNLSGRGSMWNESETHRMPKREIKDGVKKEETLFLDLLGHTSAFLAYSSIVATPFVVGGAILMKGGADSTTVLAAAGSVFGVFAAVGASASLDGILETVKKIENKYNDKATVNERGNTESVPSGMLLAGNKVDISKVALDKVASLRDKFAGSATIGNTFIK